MARKGRNCSFFSLKVVLIFAFWGAKIQKNYILDYIYYFCADC